MGSAASVDRPDGRARGSSRLLSSLSRQDAGTSRFHPPSSRDTVGRVASHPSGSLGRVYLAERYLPGLNRASADRATRAFAAQIQVLGSTDRAPEISCTFVPAEQSVLCVVRAESPEIVAVAGRRAGLMFDRIVEAESVGGLGPRDTSV
jgi:Nickel responsive protein SCO4226-like